MVKKILKWVAIVIGSVVVLVAAVALAIILSTNNRMTKKYDLQPAAIQLPSDSASVARGMQFARVQCTDCHGDNLAGKVIIDDPAIGRIDAHNLTPGKGGIGGKYTDVDWVRSIRHGVNPEGRALMIMPSDIYHNMSERDLADVIAYLKTLPPVDNVVMEKPDIKPFAKILVAMGAFGEVWHAEHIDHQAGYPVAPAEAPNAEYGEYMVDIIGCRHCHGIEMNGAPGAVPHSPFAPNLTPGGPIASWSPEEFQKALRTGWTPDGKQLSEVFMPWKATRHMSDEEIAAIYSYLKSLPKMETPEQ